MSDEGDEEVVLGLDGEVFDPGAVEKGLDCRKGGVARRRSGTGAYGSGKAEGCEAEHCRLDALLKLELSRLSGEDSTN